VIRWECRFSAPATDAAGIAPQDIAETIAGALAGQNI